MARDDKVRVRGKRVLALLTDAYGGHGGIAAYTRDVIDSLCGDSGVAEVVAMPRTVFEKPVGMPDKLQFDIAAAKGAGAYFRSILRHGLMGGRYDLIYCAHVHLAPLAVMISKITRTPWALCLYGAEVWQPTGRRLVDPIVGKADHYISLSRLTLDRFRSTWPVDLARCTIVPNAIHAEQFGIGPKNPELEERYGLRGRKVLMTLGRLCPVEQAKGFDRVIEMLPRVADRVPEISYLICGVGEDRGRLEKIADEKGVRDRVVFAGLVSEEEKADHYRLADLYVMPSKLEGFGFVFLEAMACGVPVIASRIDGGREAVLEGEIGQIVDPYDKDELAAAILEGLARPRRIPPQLGHFSFARFRERILEALAPLLDAPARR